MANMPPPVIKMNTRPVTQLHIIARLMDELDKDLNRVDGLRDAIGDKRQFRDCTDLAGKAHTSVTRMREAIAAKGGAQIAKGYK